jgi:hypothetical protein
MRSQASANDLATPAAPTMSALSSAGSGTGRKATARPINAGPCSTNAL